MLYLPTNLTEEEIKELIEQHKKTISKLENQRTLIISLSASDSHFSLSNQSHWELIINNLLIYYLFLSLTLLDC